MVPKTLCIEKEIGETPLMALSRLRDIHPEVADLPLAYAGRLDPMASGKLLVLVGDECKRQDAYRGLDKEYVVEVLLGYTSDTGDVLGIVKRAHEPASVTDTALHRALRLELGVQERAYPAYSSKTVDGVPLFYRSLEGTLPAELPTHMERIHRVRLEKQLSLSPSELQERVYAKLALAPTSNEPSKVLGADFRIQHVRESWKEALAASPRPATTISLRVTSGSGAYMRSLAARLGETLGTGGLALSIHRSKIGRFLPLPGWWLKQFC